LNCGGGATPPPKPPPKTPYGCYYDPYCIAVQSSWEAESHNAYSSHGTEILDYLQSQGCSEPKNFVAGNVYVANFAPAIFDISVCPVGTSNAEHPFTVLTACDQCTGELPPYASELVVFQIFPGSPEGSCDHPGCGVGAIPPSEL
jgi:hypothetical protein